MNIQPISKLRKEHTLQVHSVFRTIQGEGPFSGKCAVFVRLEGCNLQCPRCDTVYTGGEEYETEDLVSKCTGIHSPGDIFVITGGEPFRQKITNLCNSLSKIALVQIETNGTLPIPTELSSDVVIVCSPKTDKVHDTLKLRSHYMKYVIGSTVEQDGLPREALMNKVAARIQRPLSSTLEVFLTPEDSSDKIEARNNVVASCMRHGYTAQIQIHKVLGVE